MFPFLSRRKLIEKNGELSPDISDSKGAVANIYCDSPFLSVTIARIATLLPDKSLILLLRNSPVGSDL